MTRAQLSDLFIREQGPPGWGNTVRSGAGNPATAREPRPTSPRWSGREPGRQPWGGPILRAARCLAP
eukprot:2414265-Alexandrium_andersonii.AAC.1